MRETDFPSDNWSAFVSARGRVCRRIYCVKGSRGSVVGDIRDGFVDMWSILFFAAVRFVCPSSICIPGIRYIVGFVDMFAGAILLSVE